MLHIHRCIANRAYDNVDDIFVGEMAPEQPDPTSNDPTTVIAVVIVIVVVAAIVVVVILVVFVRRRRRRLVKNTVVNFIF